MKNRHKTLLTATIMTLGLLSAFTVGLSSWLIVNEDVIGGSATITGADVVQNRDINGISVTASGPKLGKYFFEEGLTDKSATGTLSYAVTITPSGLPLSLRNKNIYFVGSLMLMYKNGTSTERNTKFFDANFSHMAKDCAWNGNPYEMTFQPSENLLSIPSYSIPDLSEKTTYKLDFTLKQTCILDIDIRDLLISSGTYFQLQLKVGVSE